MTGQTAASHGKETPIPQGILSYLQLSGVGPVKEICFKPNRRLNIVTGDNSFGKTFLLECAWWVLSGAWAGSPIDPREDAGKYPR